VETNEQSFRNERFVQAIFDAIQDGISVLDRDLNILHVNRTMERWYSRKTNIVGHKCHEVYHDRRDVCEICPAIRSLRTRQLEVDEVPIVHDDGTVGTLELFAYPMIDSNDEVESIVEYVRDISERKQSEVALREQEQLYRSLFENNIAIMLLIDPENGDVVDANPSACSFYGFSRAELTTMKITCLNTLPPDEVYEEMNRVRADQRHYFTFRHRLADGSEREVEVYSGPLTVGGRELLCSTIHDISQRKIAEEEREHLIEELQQAVSEVKTLRGFLPICSSCKKIRDDKGYWTQVESYIRDHSDIQFSHGFCPDCAKELYPDLNIEQD